MLKKIEDTLSKVCLVGLTYFDQQGQQLKQSLLAGRVESVDSEQGISIALFSAEDKKEKGKEIKATTFVIPTDLSCWFAAPSGEFHTSLADVKVKNPDYLVTWDIYQTKENVEEGSQQWWQWYPRKEKPQVGK